MPTMGWTPKSKADTVNPKDLVGNTKVSISKLPVIAVIEGAMAMMDGAEKYGPYNWRDKEVKASVYVDAALRHLYCWFEGQELASDSLVHHLGHAIACCAILLDARAHGKLVDDRPVARYGEKEYLERVSKSSELERAIGDRNGTEDVIDPDWLERQLADLSLVIKDKQAARSNAGAK
jgi:hypothetical protein